MANSNLRYGDSRVKSTYMLAMIVICTIMIYIVFMNKRLKITRKYILLLLLGSAFVTCVLAYMWNKDVKKVDIIITIICVGVLICDLYELEDIRGCAIIITVCVFIAFNCDIYMLMAICVTLGPITLTIAERYEEKKHYAEPLIVLMILQLFLYMLPLENNWELFYWNSAFVTKSLCLMIVLIT